MLFMYFERFIHHLGFLRFIQVIDEEYDSALV